MAAYHRIMFTLLGIVCTVLLIAFVDISPAQAATVTVTTAGPGGAGASQCSIEEAINRINTGSNGDGCTNSSANPYGVNDTILFSSGVSTVRSNSTLTVNSDRSVTISDAEGITIQRGSNDTVFLVLGQLTTQNVIVNNSARGFAVSSGGTLILNNSTVENNNSYIGGSGISSAGTVVLNNSRVTGNGTNNGVGGGIAIAGGTFTINGGSQISSNNAGGNGGGIYIVGGALIINGTQSQPVRLEHNSSGGNGAAVHQSGGSVNVSGACITGNGDTAIYRNGGTNPMQMGNNWWGSSWGPFSSADGSPHDQSNGDSVENFAETGITVTDDGDPGDFAPTGNWLTTAPSGCLTCSSVSSVGGAALCY